MLWSSNGGWIGGKEEEEICVSASQPASPPRPWCRCRSCLYVYNCGVQSIMCPLMCPPGSLCVFMCLYVSLCVLMCPYVSSGVLVCPYLSLCVLMCPYVSLPWPIYVSNLCFCVTCHSMVMRLNISVPTFILMVEITLLCFQLRVFNFSSLFLISQFCTFVIWGSCPCSLLDYNSNGGDALAAQPWWPAYD